VQIIGFDNDKYLKEQSEAILERVKKFNNKLYLEFGGKLIFDYHASRVLPGFDPNVKMRLLSQLKDKIDILLCIYSGDIERKKMRADFGITYDADALKLIDDLRDWGLDILGVVITRYEDKPATNIFKHKLERAGIKVYKHYYTKGYPTDVDVIVSDAGYGVNDYIETKNPLVIVTGPGPGSGKLATCLSQLYHDHKRGMRSGYAKFETFPIWNLSINHPVNVAYESATADLNDKNMIDHYHLEAYKQTAVNYNRDLEVFPVLKRILKKISGEDSFYKSPTDMGVNRAGYGIIDDEAVQEAAKQEIIRRYFRYSCEYAMGLAGYDTVEKNVLLMKELSITPEHRLVVQQAHLAADDAVQKQKGHEGLFCGAAIQLKDGTLITGKNSPLLHAASSLVLNAIKQLAQIPDNIHLLPPNIVKSVEKLKKEVFCSKNASMDVEETLIALSMSATTNPVAAIAMEKLKEFKGCEVHLTHIPTPGDEAGLRKLGVNLTSDANFSSKNLFIT